MQLVHSISPDLPADDLIESAVGMLSNGGLVVAPTETRYGLLVRGDDRTALQKLFVVKGRPATMPTSIFARDREELERFGELTPIARRLAARFLPGPLTLVVTAKGEWEPQVVLQNKIGLRWSSSAVIAGLLNRSCFPLTATSANLSGGSEAESIPEILASFGDRVNLYLDAGRLNGITSTVVDCTGAVPVILREGAIGQNELLDSLRDLLVI